MIRIICYNGKRKWVISLLNERQERIIMILRDNKEWMTGRELSEFLNVSDRTIRSDIEYINRKKEDALIESNVRKGYHLNDKVSLKLNLHLVDTIPQTSYERCIYIIQELLFKKNELNLIYVMNQVFVSDYTLENDLKQIKNMINPYPTLKLYRRKNYLYLEGNELCKRRFYKDLLSKEIKSNILNLDRLAYLFIDFDLHIVKDFLEETFNEYRYQIRETDIPSLIIYIGIAIERVINHHYLQTNLVSDKVINSIEYTIAQEFFKKVSGKIPIKLVDAEITLFALMLSGEQVGMFRDNKVLIRNANYTINQLITDVLQDIYIQFDVDFRNDQDLKIGLTTHIQLLLERKKKNIDISNMYLGDIKRNYPLLFEMAVQVREFIQNKLDVPIGENDISFIAQHLGGAFERTELKNKHRVLMINPNNQALSSLCVKKIESLFYEHIKIVSCVNYFEEKKVLEINPDLILTTLPLEHDLDILTVQISIFVNAEDENKIFRTLSLLDRNSYKEAFAADIKTMMDERFFYIDLDMDTPSEVVSFISDELYHGGLVEEDFKVSVLKREELSPTSFVYSFAVPHPLSALSKESKIAVALLKKPILWGEYQVKLVLLLAIHEDEQKVLCTFFDWLSNMLNDSKMMSSLMKVKSYEEFIKHIIE